MKRIYYIFILCVVCTFVISCGKKQDVKMSDKQDIKVSDKQEKETENVKNATLQTEYHIEDYENGYLIVSKLDGLLYGVIDRNNKRAFHIIMDIDHFFILLAALNNLQATGHCKVKTMDVENNH